jgi:DUF917 family protein
VPEQLARLQIAASGPVSVLDLSELPDDALIMPCGLIGSPLVLEERLLVGDEPFELLAAVERELGRTVDALMPFELPGANGLIALGWATTLDLPLVDAEGMGRPNPRLATTMTLAGTPAVPAFLVDGAGAALVIRASSWSRFARIAFSIVAGLGGVGAISFAQMDAAAARRSVIRDSVTRALAIGRAGAGSRNPAVAAARSSGGQVIGQGRIVEVKPRDLLEGSHGALLVDTDTSLLRVEFREEYLLVLDRGKIVAATPETIAVLDTETGWSILVGDGRVGEVVTIVSAPADPAWKTPSGMELAGPEAHGLPMVDLAS